MSDTTQINQLVPRLRAALRNATGGSGKASDVNFAQLQAELDAIENEDDRFNKFVELNVKEQVFDLAKTSTLNFIRSRNP